MFSRVAVFLDKKEMDLLLCSLIRWNLNWWDPQLKETGKPQLWTTYFTTHVLHEISILP